MKGLDIRQTFSRPMTCATIEKKRQAWREVFGTLPVMEITGTFKCHAGELAFLQNNKIEFIGRVWLVVRVDGEKVRVNPDDTTYDDRATVRFRMEGSYS